MAEVEGSDGVVELIGGADGKLSELPLDRIPAATTTHLRIGINQLRELPPFLGMLARLVVLDCSDNWQSRLSSSGSHKSFGPESTCKSSQSVK